MSDLPAFFMEQATASLHIQFVYELAAARVVFVNEAYRTVLGGDPAQVNAELPALLARLHPDDRAYLGHYQRLWARGLMPDEVEIRVRTPGGDEQWFCLTPSFLHAPDGRVWLGGSLRNISVSKHYQVNADRFNVRKNVTLEILSHDMSGAFVLIEQITQYLREEVPEATEMRVADMLRVLETTSQQSVKMIRDIVNLEFLTSANSDLKRTRVDVRAVLREPLLDMQRSKGLSGQQFAYVLPPEPVYALLDVNKFTQVVSNLVSNALKFTPDGKTVRVLVAPGPSSLRLQVVDEGIGIPAAWLPHVFEAFTPARRPGLRGETTTGLGLALCKTIVEWHKGTISVVSTEGQGTTFTVEIPLAEPLTADA